MRRLERVEGNVFVSRGVRSPVFKLILCGSLALGALALSVSLLVTGGTVSAEGERAEGFASGAVTGGLTSRRLSSDDTPYLNCRFGVGQSENPITSYDIAPLNAGWYANWGAQATPARPGGIEYVQVVRVSDGAGYGEREHPDPPSYSPSGDALATIVAANPGSLWLVGNEPDCIWQDNVLPENYAEAYHEVYAAIKAADPTAKVSVGGIVQPTPLRRQYLDAVLDAYMSRYGRALPTDAWNIHTYILREERDGWGCEIPPGSAADEGELYILDDTDDVDIFGERIREFRRWMYERGYWDTPLIITEYGTLLPYYDDYFYDSEGNPFDEDRARDFMYSTFDFLRTASDPRYGYRADENRLVQRWLWYSVDDTDYGGRLFNSDTTEPTALGMSFGDYTGALSPSVDLLAVDVSQVGPTPFSPTDAATVTLQAQLSNVGNVALAEPITVRFLDEEGQTIGSDIVDGTLPGCADTRSVTVSWSDVSPGAHAVRVVVDPENEISESDETNNEVRGVALVAKHRMLLPVTFRNRRP